MDLLRILASFLVVVIHTCSGLFPIDAVGTELFWASDLFNSCSRIAVPLFVMLSGAFLLDPARPFQTRAFFKANVLHIAASYLFWASLYAILDMRVHANGFSPFKTVIIFISTVLSGFGHLWFMPLLLGLYLLVPLLRKICESRQLTVYYILLSVVFCFTANPIGKLPLVGDTASKIFSGFGMQFVLGYTGYFVAGYALRCFDISKKQRIVLYGAGILSAFVTVGGTFWLEIRSGEINSVLCNNLFLNIFLQACAVFVFFRYLRGGKRIRLSERTRRAITKWSSLTFGVYLTHPIMSRLASHLPSINVSPFILIPVTTVLVYFALITDFRANCSSA